MDKSKPFAVTAPNGKTHLLVMNATDGLPAAFALMGTRAADKVAIRITGGCKGMSAEDKEDMLAFFSEALRGYKGLIWSGATRQVDKIGQIDPMVTEIPGLIASENPGCVALGTLPRTDMLSLQQDSRLVLDEWGTVPNPSLLGILIVQNGPEGKMDWDGDLDAYFRMMQNWQTYAGFGQLGLISWNGGPITEKEIMRSINLGWPTILIEGSGRVTDEIVAKVNGRDKEFIKQLPDVCNIWTIKKNDPADLGSALHDLKFIN